MTSSEEHWRKLREIRFEAELKAEEDREAAAENWVRTYDQLYHQSLIGLAAASVDRASAAAELVQKSAAAIGTLYGAVLGVSFSVAQRPLPPRGLVPALFLALAIVLAMIYRAYLTYPQDIERPRPHTSPAVQVERLSDAFIIRANTIVDRRSYALRAGVVALGLGVALLPVPFIRFPGLSQESSLPPFPNPPPVGTNKELASLLRTRYQAEVAEVVEVRRLARQTRQEDDDLVWRLALVGVALTFLVPAVLGRKPRKREKKPRPAAGDERQ